MYGITIGVAWAHGYSGLMRDLPLDFSKQIYRKDYWDINHCEEIAQWYEPVALELFDTSVNMGARTAAKYFQIALNVMNKDQLMYFNIAVDRIIGPTTLMTMRKLTSDFDKKCVLKILNIQQGMGYLSICQSRESQEKFIRDWLQRVSI